MKNKDLRISFILLSVGLFITIASPYLLTRHGLIDFTQTGPIGDTIGGITSPITNLIGAILVFYALKAQIESNEITRRQFEQQNIDEVTRKRIIYLSEQLNIIQQDIREFSYSFTISSRRNGEIISKENFDLRGSSAIEKFISDLSFYDSKHTQGRDIFETDTKTVELFNLLLMLDSFIDVINNDNLSEYDKKYFKSVITYLYNYKIKPSFRENEKHRQSNMQACPQCGEKHKGIPDKFFIVAESIEQNIAL